MTSASITPLIPACGLAAFVKQAGVFDLLDSAVAILDVTGQCVYRNAAFVRLDAVVRDTPDDFGKHASLLDCESPRRVTADCVKEGKTVTLPGTFYYGRNMPVALTLVLRPVLVEAGRVGAILVTIAEESIEHDNRHLLRLQHHARELADRIKQLSVERRATEQLLRALLKQSPVPTMVFNAKRQVLHMNDAAAAVFGGNLRERLGQSCERFFDCHRLHGGCPLLDHKGEIRSEESAAIAHDGRAVAVLRSAVTLVDADEAVIVEAFIDIADRKHAQREMEKLSRALAQTADSVIITRPDGVIEYVNPAFEQTTGHRREELVGQTPRIVKSGRHDQAFYQRLWRTIRGGEIFREVFVNRRKNGEIYYEEKTITPLKDADGRITHFISTGKDISERMEIQERLQYLAHHDTLTDLPNRFLFIEHVKQAIALGPRKQSLMAVLFLDLDRFKLINDTLGHSVGDDAIRLAGERINRALRRGDMVARLGGDEFAILLQDLASADDIPRVIQHIQSALAQPMTLQDRDFYMSSSIGVSLYPHDGNDPQTLLRNADSAMYRAKEQGRNTYRFYSAEMSTKAFERLTLETSMRRALERGDFELVYQPQVDLASGRPFGVEALLRWRHAELGIVSPTQFIPLAEETGLIVEIDEWVLHTVATQLAAWRATDLPRFSASVNLSGRSFVTPGLPQRITKILGELSVPAAALELEITEGVIMHGGEANLRVLESLKEQGLQLAIDDFGTGYSSLSYLKRFSIDVLKIDQSFVRDIVHDPDDAAIVNAVIALARSLKLKVIAEGVETDEQRAFLRNHGCTFAQGYLFARPLPAAEVETWLREAFSRAEGRD